MADYSQEQLLTALHNADKAGDTAGATRIAQMLHTQYGMGASAQPPSTSQYVWNQFKRGVAQMPGLIGAASDALNRHVVNPALAVAHVPYQFGTSGQKMLQGGAQQAMGVRPMKAPSYPAQVAGNIAEIGGSMAVPEVGVVGKAVAAERSVVPLLKELGVIGVSGLGATEGQHLATAIGTKDLTPEQRQNREDIGYMVGSMVGPGSLLTLAKMGGIGGNWVTRMVERAGLKVGGKSAQTAAAEQLVKHSAGKYIAEPTVQRRMVEAAAVGKEVPGFDEALTLGRRTGLPQLQGIEMRLSEKPETHQRALEAEAGLDKAIQDKIDSAFPVAKVRPNDAAISALDKRNTQLEDELKKTDRSIRNITGQQQKGDPETVGRRISALVSKALATATKIKNNKYAAVIAQADKEGAKVNVDDVYGVARGILTAHENLFQDSPGVAGDIVNLFKTGKVREKALPGGTIRTGRAASGMSKAPKIIPASTFLSLVRESRREMNTLHAIAARGGDGAQAAMTKAAQLGKLNTLLSEKVAEMESSTHGKLGAMLKDANEYYANTFAPRFRRGFAAELQRTGRFGEPAVDEANIASNLLFRPRNSSSLREFLDATGGTKQAHDAAERSLIDLLGYSASQRAGGKLTSDLLRKFTQTHAQSLDLMPATKAKLSSVESALSAMEDQTVALRSQQQELARSTLAKVAGTETPEQVVKKALTSPAYMDTLLSHQNAETRTSLAKALASHILDTSDPEKILADHEAQFEKALGKTRMKALKSVATAIRIRRSIQTPAFPNIPEPTLEDALRKKTGTGIAQVGGFLTRSGSIGVRKGYYAAGAGVKWLMKMRNEDVDKLWEELIFGGPKVVEEIDKLVKGNAPASVYRVDPHMLLLSLRFAAASPYSHKDAAQ